MKRLLAIQKYVSVDPHVCHGKPCFRGTRIMVSTVLELLAAGQTPKQIRRAYPGLTAGHLRAARHPDLLWEFSPKVQRWLRVASQELRAGKTQSMREFLSALEDRLDETDPVLTAETEAARREFRQGLARARSPQRLRRRALRSVGSNGHALSSLATRVKARALPMRVIVRETQAARRILSARLRPPVGETAESVVRTMRDRRYGKRSKPGTR